jgi:hypothetical protein
MEINAAAASFQAPVLFTLAEDLRHMEIRVDVDEADLGSLAEGQTTTFGVNAHPDRRFPERIRMLRFGPGRRGFRLLPGSARRARRSDRGAAPRVARPQCAARRASLSGLRTM